jgi:hypothetical protein
VLVATRPGPGPLYSPLRAAVAQLARASACHAEGRGFESHQPLPFRARHGEEDGLRKDESPSQLIDARIDELDDWRGEMLSRLRALIKEADPEVVEEWKWRGVPVWSHGGMLCTGETYKSVVKLTFAKGASLEDPSGLFNSSLDGNVRRAIDIHEGEAIDEDAFRDLIREAVALNESSRRRT